MHLPVTLRLACAAAISFAAPIMAADASSNAPVLTPLHSFRMHLVDATPQGTLRREITFVAPDKLRVEIPESSMVVVAIAKNVWLRQPNGSWQKAEYAPGVDPLADVRVTMNIAQQLNGPQVHYRGLATLGGAPVKVYDITLTPHPGIAPPATRVWIGARDGYPHQIQQRNGPLVFTAVYSAWNQPLSVSQP
jgi:outer membrane lipoprotein-sorting protein